MNVYFEGYLISDDKNLLQVDRVHELLLTTYWAQTRPKETVVKSIENSFCFGIYDKDNVQVGFARCVTDFTTMFYLADVVVDEAHRGKGLGKALIKNLTEHEHFATITGLLNTRDAHGLYEQYGFERDNGESTMRRRRKVETPETQETPTSTA